uniref:Uncharacterized protein n=1 Tax=Ciona savignyi TaxID=51511 RepID=H2Z7J5_CIOSA
ILAALGLAGIGGPSVGGGINGGVTGFPTPVPQCPYQTYNGQLTGSTAGCCQRNYCYTPRSTILRSASGIATYQGNWGEYEACSVSCGGGTRKRTRPCIRYHANDTCEHESEQIHRCNVAPCPNFGPWTPYGQCSSTCGAGTQTRSRPCLPAGSTCADDNQGGATQSQPCNNGACPVYSNWSPYGACDAVCGVGQQTRSRTCTAASGGAPCTLPLVDTKSCAVSCGSCQEVPGPCQNYNKCYRVITTQC